MKKLVLSAALAAVLASPAFAQSYDPEDVGSNVLPPQVWQQPAQPSDAGSFAYAQHRPTRVERTTVNAAIAAQEDADIALREKIDAPDVR